MAEDKRLKYVITEISSISDVISELEGRLSSINLRLIILERYLLGDDIFRDLVEKSST